MVYGVLDRRVLPELHVSRLVTAGDPQRFGVADRLDDEGVEGAISVLEKVRGGMFPPLKLSPRVEAVATRGASASPYVPG
jgi:hypothetical protein